MKSSGSESDIGDYLSNLQKKTAGNKFKIHIDGLSDLSLSDLSDKKENDAPVKSKFLKTTKTPKKSPIENVSQTKKSKRKKKEKKPKKKVNEDKPAKKPVAIETNDDFSDLDMDFSFSSNSKSTKKPSKPISNFVPKLQLNLSSRKSIDKIDKSDDNDESSFGRDGRRFLKPKNTAVVKTETVENENKMTTPDDISSSRDISSSPLKSTLRSSRSNSNKKKVTILENKHDTISSLDADIQNSFEEIMKNKSDSGSDTEKNFYGANIMSFDDLIEDDLNKESIDDIPLKSGNFKTSEKIMSIEELEDDYYIKTEFSDHKSAHSSQETNNSLSEIKTVPSVTPRKSVNQTINQSISEIISISQKESSEINSTSSKIYSTDFEDSKKENIKQSTLETKKSTKKSPSYSSDFTDQDPTIYSIPKGRSKKEVPIKPSTSINYKLPNPPQIHNIPIPPGAEMENVEPVPIAHYIVSPEALESITAYSPAMLLMTNMFRQQIQMTSSFIETQRRLYESLLSSIRPAYQYSSLEETKEFIKLNKTKPLTMKEALRLVENEEN